MAKMTRRLIGVVALLALVAVALLVASNGLDSFPGNIVIKAGDTRYKVPLGLMVLVSVLLTIVLNARRR